MFRVLVNSLKFSRAKDLYTVLNLPASSTHEQIKKQYIKLAKLYHPDYNPSTADKFKEINAAYEILGDQSKRKEYDNNINFNTNRAAGQSTHNPNYYQDPFRHAGVYNTHRSQGRRTSYEQHAQRQADTYREYFRQQAQNQENFWRDFHQQQQKNRDQQFTQLRTPVGKLWKLFLFGLGFSFFMTLFTIRYQSMHGQYVKVIDPDTNKVTIVPKAQFQRNRTYYQIASELGRKRKQG